MKTIVVSILLVLLVAGCATSYPSAPADTCYGNPPENYQALIVNHMSGQVDPSKVAQYRFVEPRTAFVIQRAVAGGDVLWGGYAVDFFVDLKGDGEQPGETFNYVALLRNDLRTNRVVLAEPTERARLLVHYSDESRN